MLNFINQLKSTDNQLEMAWSKLSEFSAPPPGVTGEIVVGLRDFFGQYKNFESPLWDECLRLRSVVSSSIGVNALRRELSPLLNDLMVKNSEKRPRVLTGHAKIGSCLMRIEEFLFWYDLAGEKTRMGEMIRQCYPTAGIPCGWDENSGVLFLYHTDLK
jgi:hypothetical protein